MHRRNVDDAPAATLFYHLLGGQLGAEEGALQIDCHDLVILLLGRIQHRRTRLDPGIVDHYVQAAKRLDRFLHQQL